MSSTTLRKVEVVSPVPADIDIANSVEPFHISEIAKELNLSPTHYDLYGKYKAKVPSFCFFPKFLFPFPKFVPLFVFLLIRFMGLV